MKKKVPKDVYGREISKGDFLALARTNYCGTIRIETVVVTDFTPAGHVKYPGGRIAKPHQCAILMEPDYLPEDVYFDAQADARGDDEEED